MANRSYSAPRPEFEVSRTVNIMWTSFMASQGRSDVQIAVLDALVRTWREEGHIPNWSLLRSEETLARVVALRMHHRHSPYAPEDVRIQFTLWWELFLRIAEYVFSRDCSKLPQPSEEARFRRTFVLPLDDERANSLSQFMEEDVATFMGSFAWYCENDPRAEMSADDAIRSRALPALLAGDAFWVGSEGRPGRFSDDAHASLVKDVLLTERSRPDRRRPSNLEVLYTRMSEMLDEVDTSNSDTFPEYLELLQLYKQRHPGEQVNKLHIRKKDRH